MYLVENSHDDLFLSIVQDAKKKLEIKETYATADLVLTEMIETYAV